MKPFFGQRGENVVGGDTLTPQYPSLAFGMDIEHYLWEGHSEGTALLPKVLWLCHNKALSDFRSFFCSKHKLSVCCLLYTVITPSSS